MSRKTKDEGPPEHAKRSWQIIRVISKGDEPNIAAGDAAIDAMIRRSIKDHGA